jgi:uncharacterized protein (DUF983 family)
MALEDRANASARAVVREVGYMRMLARALRKKCPRCGGGNLFRSWFQMREHCPRCGYRFVREEGFFLGAYVINFVVAELALGCVLVVMLAFVATGHHVNAWTWIGIGAVVQIIVPAFFYPFSRTVWAAFDLMMRPLEPSEEAEAIVARGSENENENESESG